MPCAADDFSDANSIEPGRATDTTRVSPLVSFTQLQAVPPSAAAVYAKVPDFGAYAACSVKLGLKSYMVWGDTSVLQAIEIGWAGVPAVGVGLGVTVAVGESVGELRDVYVELGVDGQTQPVRAAAVSAKIAPTRSGVRADVAIR